MRLTCIILKGIPLTDDYPSNRKSFEDFVSNVNLRSLEHLDVSNCGMKEKQQDKLRKYLLDSNRNLKSHCVIFGDNETSEVTQEESQFVELSMH